MNNLPKIGVPLLIALTFGLLLVAKSIVTIGSGEAGVEYRLFGGGVVTDEPPLDEGLRFILPWNSVFIYEVRQQEVFEYLAQVIVRCGQTCSRLARLYRFLQAICQAPYFGCLWRFACRQR